MKKYIILIIISLSMCQHTFAEQIVTNNPQKNVSRIVIQPGEFPRNLFPESTNETVTKYNQSDIALIAKVISIQREPKIYKELIDEISKENNRIKTLKDEYLRQISLQEKSTSSKLEKEALRKKLKEVSISFNSINNQLRKISDKTMNEKRKGITFVNETIISQMQNRKEELHKQLISLTNKRSDLKKQYSVVELKKGFIIRDIRAYKREIRRLSKLHKNPEDKYESSITVIMEVITSYKGKNSEGHLLSFFSPKKTKTIGFRFAQLSFGDSLYFLKPNELITIFYSSTNKRVINSFINTDIDEAHEKMEKIISGTYKDFIPEPIID